MEEELVTIDDRSDTMDQTFFSSPGYYVPTNTIYQDKKHNLISGEWENFK